MTRRISACALAALLPVFEVGGVTPDYFSTTRSGGEPAPAESSDLEGRARSIIYQANSALEELAGGRAAAAIDFALLFDSRVDYYDQGEMNPQKIADEKVKVFKNYSMYSWELVGEPTLSEAERPDLKWISFTYKYQITKANGAKLRGTAVARWKVQVAGAKMAVVATREVTKRE